MNRKSKIIVSVVGITIVLLALLGITYAYYLTRIEGNTNTNSISVTTADLKLVYGDGNGAITANDIMPGTTITKTFTVTNSGKSVVEGYLVVLENVVNELNRKQDLTYTLECKLSDDTSCGENTNLYPNTAEYAMIFSNDIESNVTQYYTLTIHYENLTDTDQSEDMGSVISGKVNIYDANALKTTGATNVQGTLAYSLLSHYGGANNINENGLVDESLGDTEYDEMVISINIISEDVLNGKNYQLAGYDMYDGNDFMSIEAFYSYFVYCVTESLPCGESFIVDGQEYFVKGYELKNNYVSDYSVIVPEDTLPMPTLAYYDGTRLQTTSEVEYDYLVGCANGTNSCGDWLYLEGMIASGGYYYVFDYNLTESGSVSLSVTYPYWDEITLFVSESSATSEMRSSEDDYGTTYYYRGNISNNIVSFANKTWSIIRVNGDGSIRMISHDTINSAFNESSDHKKFVGYMYGTDDNPYANLYDSTMKTNLENWYRENLLENYHSYVADSVFCNDREEIEGSYTFTANGLKCNRKDDKFTVDDEIIGNGDLTYPIGLITAEEAIKAGYDGKFIDVGVYLDDIFYYSYTMTPSTYESAGDLVAMIESGRDDGFVMYGPTPVNSTNPVNPVINLKANVNFTIDENGVYVITTN